MKRALITGGSGFVGRHLSRLLEGDGAEVTSFSASPSEKDEGITNFCLQDIRNADGVAKLFDRLAPDCVYHLAGITTISAAAQDEKSAFEVNVWGTRNVLRAAGQLSKRTRFLNVSTSQVYGESVSSPVSEDALVCPQSTYAVSKAMAELLCHQRSSNCEVVIARPFNHSGPGQSAKFVLPFLAQQIAAIECGLSQPIIRAGDLEVRRDFTDVRDVVRAYQLLLSKGRDRSVYNVCSGNIYLLADALEILRSLTDEKIRVERDPAKVRKGQSIWIQGDPSKLNAETGWNPTISF